MPSTGGFEDSTSVDAGDDANAGGDDADGDVTADAGADVVADGDAAVTSRRGFLRAAAGGAIGAGAAGATADTAAGQEAAGTYRFGGEVSGWQGVAPASIEGQTNPTIYLTPGERYEVTWENLDGVPHDFTLLDAQGSTLAQTETITEQGATATLTFTTEENMAQYICTIHPNSMVGDISFESPPQAGGGGFDVPWAAVLIAAALAAAVLSPVAFAVLLWRAYLPSGDRPTRE